MFLSRFCYIGGSYLDVVVQVRLTESLIHLWSHHLDRWVQDYFSSGALGGFFAFNYDLLSRYLVGHRELNR
jgi:hypothetical protein